VESDDRVTEKELIQGCILLEPKAQQALYRQYAPLVLGISRRYLKSDEDAEDVMVEAMIKIFRHLEDFKGEGSFEGWIRKIAVREALMFMRKNRPLEPIDLREELQVDDVYDAEQSLSMAEILHAMDSLPPGYRAVFNLYVVEGYKHREIAELLHISINTSKSQLAIAKSRMQAFLKKSGFVE
jgi:RNA polymerase sigma factor (sigma-70 family)